MTDNILYHGWTAEEKTRTVRQRINGLAADITEHIQAAEEADAAGLANALVIARGFVLDAERVISGYRDAQGELKELESQDE